MIYRPIFVLIIFNFLIFTRINFAADNYTRPGLEYASATVKFKSGNSYKFYANREDVLFLRPTIKRQTTPGDKCLYTSFGCVMGFVVPIAVWGISKTFFTEQFLKNN